MRRGILLHIIILVTLVSVLLVPAGPPVRPTSVLDEPPVVFAELLNPLGETTDSNGNVYVSSDRTFYNLITKLAPDGTKLAELPIGDILAIGQTAHLATDSSSGRILALEQDGTLAQVDFNLTSYTPLL